jgi:hypothetical protein
MRMGLKRKKSKQSNPLKTSSLSLMKKAVSYLVTRYNLGAIGSCQYETL